MGYNGLNYKRSYLISVQILLLLTKDILMNKQKKLKQIHEKRLKTAKAKRNPNKKAPYISKAEREKLENLEQLETP
jgi:hypothetical protein